MFDYLTYFTQRTVQDIRKRAEISFAESINRFKAEDSRLIFCDPRGGSTWLTSIISTSLRNSYVIWEPLDLTSNPKLREIGFSWRQYIKPSESWIEAKNHFDLLLEGRIIEPGFMQTEEHPPLSFNKQQLIFKICRGNNLLPWMLKNYSFRYQPIYMVRHPFAVVLSQLRHGDWKHAAADSFSLSAIGKPLLDDCNDLQEYLDGLNTIEERLTALWCISNHTVLNTKQLSADCILIHYEDLFLNPEREIGRIFHNWMIPSPSDVTWQMFDQESITSKGKLPINKADQLSKWQFFLKKDKIKRMMSVLKYFRVIHYSDDALPLLKL